MAGQDEKVRIPVYMTIEERDALDDWRRKKALEEGKDISRTEAIRIIVRDAVGPKG